MRLRARLERLSSPLPEPVQRKPLLAKEAFPSEIERPERIAQLRALIGEVVARDRRRDRVAGEDGGSHLEHGSVPSLPPFGAVRETPAGPLHILERWLEPRHRHGRIGVCRAVEVDPVLVSKLALDSAFEGTDLSRMLILDTETTGLAGGAGTVPFLIGLGLFDGGVLKVEQLFLRNFGAEAPLLHHLAERIAGASLLVTYNGKAFDWPLLRARFILNRVPLPAAPPHLDLLHCARRLWKGRLPSVRLTEVEAALLGMTREDDVPGAEIPALYLRYLRGGDPRALAPVLTHNENDVVALAALLWRMAAHFACVHAEDDPHDHLAYAKLALRGGDLERAESFACAVSGAAAAPELRWQASWVRAAVARRRGDLHGAALAFEEALAISACERTAGRAHLALARLYERQLRDLARAHRHARFTMSVEGPEAHGRRLGRLRRKLERLFSLEHRSV
jgi:uncharacterized protein